MAESDFPCPCIIGYGSSPSRCGPAALGPSGQTRDLPVSDAVLLHVMCSSTPAGRLVPRITALLVLRSTITTASAPAMRQFRGSIGTPCNCCVRFVAVVTAGSRNTHYRATRYGLLGPVFHRLDCASHTGAFGHSAQGQRELRRGDGGCARGLYPPARSGAAARLLGRDIKAARRRDPHATARSARTTSALRLRIRAQWYGQPVHVICPARRLARRQSHRAAHGH